MMHRRTILLFFLALLLAGSAVAQEQQIATDTVATRRGLFGRKRPYVERIKKEPQKRVSSAYKGEWMMGLGATYGTLSSNDSELWVYLDNINLEGTMTSIKPFVSYFYRDDQCVGLRLGYQYLYGNIDTFDLDLGEGNDINMSLEGLKLVDRSYSASVFHRAYVALDPKGQFNLFSEVEGTVQFGRGEFTNGSGEDTKFTESKSVKCKIDFSPGMSIYIFPQVSTFVSIGLGGIQYSSVKQYDENGEKIGTRHASKMRFRLNVFDINFGINVHLWSKKKMNRL